jgi:hypothetical protein
MQFRLAGGAKKISGVSGGTPYTVEDVTEIYKSQLVGFPYPVTDMASGKQLTFGVDYDNSVFVARVGFQPAAPVNVEVRGGFKYDGETLKAIGYYKTTVPLTEVKLATIKLPLDGGWPTWQGP